MKHPDPDKARLIELAEANEGYPTGKTPATFVIIINDRPYDVVEHYRDKHRMVLPNMPSMTVGEIACAATATAANGTWCVTEETGKVWYKEQTWTTAEFNRAIPLHDRQKFAVYPDGHY